jgi:thiamine biosynthesis lipoprotein ApbE
MKDQRMITVLKHRINQQKQAQLEAEIDHAKAEIEYIQASKKRDDEISALKSKLFLEEIKDANQNRKSGRIRK